MKTKVNHINKQRLRYESNRLAIRVAYGWSEEKYHDLMIDLGMEFLSQLHGAGGAGIVVKIRNKRTYWFWFKHEFELLLNKVMKYYHNDLDLVEENDFVRIVRSHIMSDQMAQCYCHDFLK